MSDMIDPAQSFSLTRSHLLVTLLTSRVPRLSQGGAGCAGLQAAAADGDGVTIGRLGPRSGGASRDQAAPAGGKRRAPEGGLQNLAAAGKNTGLVARGESFGGLRARSVTLKPTLVTERGSPTTVRMVPTSTRVYTDTLGQVAASLAAINVLSRSLSLISLRDAVRSHAIGTPPQKIRPHPKR